VSGASALPAVWAAVYTALNVAAITSTLGCAVYDDVPQGSAYPYLRMQSPTENRLDTMGKAGKDITLQLHVFSSNDSYDGGGQAQAIVSAACTLLNYPSTTTAPFDLTASGFDCLMCRPEDLHDAGDEDAGGVLIKHYVQTVRVWVMER
jgi:hypothetical protein